jgi:hypothetical protein
VCGELRRIVAGHAGPLYASEASRLELARAVLSATALRAPDFRELKVGDLERSYGELLGVRELVIGESDLALARKLARAVGGAGAVNRGLRLLTLDHDAMMLRRRALTEPHAARLLVEVYEDGAVTHVFQRRALPRQYW